MKKRTEIQQDLKRGFGSAPTGIKKWGKWLAVGFVVYVAMRFVCAFVGGLLPMLGVSAVVVFLIRAVWRILSVFVSLCVLALLLILFCVIL